MIFRKKINKKILGQNKTDQDYWTVVKNQFVKKRSALWSLRFVFVLLFVAIFANFLANDKPIYCKIEGVHYWPVFKEYVVDFGLAKWEAKFFTTDWTDHNYEKVIWPLIPYAATTQDINNTHFKSPFGEQNILSNRYRHWMGTDHLGRDVAAGMIAGTRIAFLVGLIAMSIATLIGGILGSLAGYFGDDRLKVSRIRFYLSILALVFGYFYAFMSRSYVLTESTNFWWEILKSLIVFTGILLFANLLASALKRISFLRKKITIPIDLIVMRMIEVMNSIPGFLFILALVSIFSSRSIFNIMIIIGLISWTGIARFIRGELLRVRSLKYIEAAQAMAFDDRRILFKHAIPNALTPVLITIVFGFAAAILIESALSFLGIGIDVGKTVSWGSMLTLARNSFSAWWLAIFPGMAIFITVTLFNLIGEGLSDAMDPRLNQHED